MPKQLVIFNDINKKTINSLRSIKGIKLLNTMYYFCGSLRIDVCSLQNESVTKIIDIDVTAKLSYTNNLLEKTTHLFYILLDDKEIDLAESIKTLDAILNGDLFTNTKKYIIIQSESKNSMYRNSIDIFKRSIPIIESLTIISCTRDSEFSEFITSFVIDPSTSPRQTNIYPLATNTKIQSTKSISKHSKLPSETSQQSNTIHIDAETLKKKLGMMSSKQYNSSPDCCVIETGSTTITPCTTTSESLETTPRELTIESPEPQNTFSFVKKIQNIFSKSTAPTSQTNLKEHNKPFGRSMSSNLEQNDQAQISIKRKSQSLEHISRGGITIKDSNIK